jgi:hypothetical protein
MEQINHNTPLINGVSQFEVDFVVPRMGKDIPLGIDPFLLFKSRDTKFLNLHDTLLKAFNFGIDAVRAKDFRKAEKLFQFPEVPEIGLGYTKKGKHGSGLGTYLSTLIIETLIDSPKLLERGVKHVEEMQLVSIGIGPDRISDIAANIFKDFFITYTQEQSKLWGIPMAHGVPVSHIFDLQSMEWFDGYFDLPLSPIDNTPIILVPRRLVRALPWINYEDFFRLEFSSYLRAKRVRGRFARKKTGEDIEEVHQPKETVISVARKEVERIERYVRLKESSAVQAQPSINYIDGKGHCFESDQLAQRLRSLEIGREQAAPYQKLILEILNYLFVPELIDGELEARTIDGTERRDIIFTNDSDASFWEFLRTEHSNLLVMFETKNTQAIEVEHINQTATYLGDRLGRCGFIIGRRPVEEAQKRKIFGVYNDSHPRKVILTLSDFDIEKMLNMKCNGEDPMRYIQKLYRTFKVKVQ